MKHTFISTILVFILSGKLCAFSNQPIGARASAMANSTVGGADVWSVFHNQAGLARLKNMEAGIYYENKFLLPELSLKGLAFAAPLKSGVLGLSVSHYGFSLYNETQAGLAFSRSLGEKVSAGVQVNLFNTYIGEGYGNQTMVSAEAGILAELTDAITLGAHIYNPNRTKISDFANERIPTIMRLGMNFKLSEKVLMCAEVLKDTQHKPIVKFGIEYEVAKDFFLRTGVSTNPSRNSFGFGYKQKQYTIDIASSKHPLLGYSIQTGLNYQF
jgi:hypothetical protein